MKTDLQHIAVQLLRRIDFGRRHPEELNRLEHVTDLLARQGYQDPDLIAAIRYFKQDPERARQHVYGPTPNGDGQGALQRLMDERKEDMTIIYQGAVYRLADRTPIHDALGRFKDQIHRFGRKLEDALLDEKDDAALQMLEDVKGDVLQGIEELIEVIEDNA